MKSIILYSILSFLTTHVCIPQNYSDSLDYKLDSTFQTSGLPGFAVSIVNTKEVLFSKGYGFANIEKRIPYTEQTTQQIASISKTFIAISLMKCIEEGHFTFETPINDLLSFKVNNPHIPKDTIRIKHLVTHTSGIIDSDNYWRNTYFLNESPAFESKSYTNDEEYFFKAISQNIRVDEASLLRNYLIPGKKWYSNENFSSTLPGQSYSYCNVGAALTAHIIETVQGIPYYQYVKNEIFEPLKMVNTNWIFDPPIQTEKEAILYLNNGEPCPLYAYSDYSDGGIRSSNYDMQKYLIEMIKGSGGTGTLLSNESYSKMFKPTIDADETDSVGVFWNTHKYLGDRIHTGSGAGIATVVNFNPQDQIGCFLICNHETDIEKQSVAYVTIWKTLIKYRKLLTKDKMH